MRCSFTIEGHEDALGLAPFNGHNDGLTRSEESAASSTDRHIVGAVVGDDDRQFALGSQEAGSAAGQFVETERIGMPCHRTGCIGTLERVLEEGRITEDGVEKWKVER